MRSGSGTIVSFIGGPILTRVTVRLPSSQPERPGAVHRQAPLRRHHRRGVALEDQGRAVEPIARAERFPLEGRHLPPAPEPGPAARGRRRRALLCRRRRRSRPGRPGTRPPPAPIRSPPAIRRGVAVELPVGGGEGPVALRRKRVSRSAAASIGIVVSCPARRSSTIRRRTSTSVVRRALAATAADGLPRQLVEQRRRGAPPRAASGARTWRWAKRSTTAASSPTAESSPASSGTSTSRMPRVLGQGRGVLAAGAAEGHQGVARRVVAPAQRDRGAPRRPCARRRSPGSRRAAPPAATALALRQLAPQLAAAAPLGRLRVDRDAEALRVEAAQEEVDVGQGQGTAGAVAGRARIGAGALRAHRQPTRADAADRAAPGRHRLDGEGRRQPAGRRPPGARRRTRRRRRSGPRRCWCRPCRRRSPARSRSAGPQRRPRPRRPPGRTAGCPWPGSCRPAPARRRWSSRAGSSPRRPARHRSADPLR